jgi:hypothetical protein
VTTSARFIGLRIGRMCRFMSTVLWTSGSIILEEYLDQQRDHETAKFFLRLTNKALRHENVWGGGGSIDPRFLDLDTSWKWVVNSTPRPLYPRGRAPVPIG